MTCQTLFLHRDSLARRTLIDSSTLSFVVVHSSIGLQKDFFAVQTRNAQIWLLTSTKLLLIEDSFKSQGHDMVLEKLAFIALISLFLDARWERWLLCC